MSFVTWNSNFVYENLDDESMLVNLQTEKVIHLDRVANLLLQWVLECNDISDVVECAKTKFEGDPREIENDIAGLIQKLIDEEVLLQG